MQGNRKHGGNVVTMSGYQQESRFLALSQVEAYWEGLRQGRDVPMRSDIDPRGIEDALEYAFILERIAPGLARLRVAGSHLSDVMGMEVRGMPITSFVPPNGRAGFSETLEQVMTGPCKARVQMSAETGIGKPPLEGRMLLLPLRSDFGEITRVLGCFDSQGNIGRAPRRFNILRSDLDEIGDIAKSPPASGAPDLRRHKTPQSNGLCESGTAFRFDQTGEGATTRRPGYLKLVKTDE